VSVRVLLWRHGRTAHNHGRVWQGRLDTDLDAVGRAQADRAAAVLAGLVAGAPLSLVTSDLRRAVDTAAALARLVGVEPLPDPRLREVDAGRWEGLTRDGIAAAGMAEELAAWRRGEDIRVGVTGERRSEVSLRGAAAVAEHAAAVPPGGSLVVAAHGGVLRGSVMALLGFDPAAWTVLGGLANGHWAELVVDPGCPAERPTAGSPAGPLAHRRRAWQLRAYNVGAPGTP
jgi:probable phosphoglycerate mutase